MHPSSLPGRALIAVAVCACATAPAVTPTPNSDESRTQAILANSIRWSGTLNPTQSFTGAAVNTTRQKAFGTVALTVSPNRPSVSHVNLTVSVPIEPGLTNLGWAIHQGNCGNGSPPVMAPGTFPTIVLSANGRGTVDDDIAFALPLTGTYHVNVFRGNGTQLNDVITCSNLRRD